ncbi:MAG: hypothetical protein WDM90_12700 [Ferruginibacter sp.]
MKKLIIVLAAGMMASNIMAQNEKVAPPPPPAAPHVKVPKPPPPPPAPPVPEEVKFTPPKIVKDPPPPPRPPKVEKVRFTPPVIVNDKGYAITVHQAKDPIIMLAKKGLTQKIKMSVWNAKPEYFENKLWQITATLLRRLLHLQYNKYIYGMKTKTLSPTSWGEGF